MRNVANALAALESTGGQQSADPAVRRAVASLRKEQANLIHPDLGFSDILALPSISAMLTNTTSSAYAPQWPAGNGRIKAIFAGTQDGAIASLSSMQARIRVVTPQGSRELISAGSAAGYAPMIALRGGLQGDDLKWHRLADFAVSSNAPPWEVYFQNLSAGTLTPFLLFGYVRD